MEIYCPKCGRQVPADDINIQAALAKCAPCASVFGIAHMVPDAAPSKSPVEMPKAFRLDREGAALVLTRSWRDASAWALVPFCLFWNGFLIVWYTMAYFDHFPVQMVLFPLIHVAVGVGITYGCAAKFVNHTRIKLGYEEITIEHGPMWWPGRKSVLSRSIDQVFCEEIVSRGKNGVSVSYDVSLLLQGGDRIKLLTGLPSSDQARFIEQQAELELRIADRPVAGELSQ